MFSIPSSPAGFVALVVNLVIILIIAEAIVSNVIAFGGKLSPYNPWVRNLRKIVNPILDPVRKLLPPRTMGGWDLSPMIVIILLQILVGFVAR